MMLPSYDVDILRAVFEGAIDIDGVTVASLLPRDIVRRRVRSLVMEGALIRHPHTGALSLTFGGREALDRAKRGGAA